tara:strand:- start:5986 stop:6507 length:522 start_codon:yes stop_codon:yes gene_type:complete
MDQIKTPVKTEAVEVDEIQIADAVALFNRALEMSDNDREAATELFEKSFDGMMELALEGDVTAQHNVALMYEKGIGEPYDDDISVFLEWTIQAEDDHQAFLDSVFDQIHAIESARYGNDEIIEADDNADSHLHADPEKEARKLRRLYLLKEKMERMGFTTGANRDEYHDPEND